MRIESIGPRDRAAMRRFARLPFGLHARDPLWAPEFGGELRALMARRHPFFAHSEAAFFLASEGGVDLGRVAVLEHRPYNAHHGERTAFFCLFETAERQDSADALLGAAEDWARGRGLSRLIGQKGFLRQAGQGFLVEGFEYRPATGVPWNQPWVPRLVEAAGFSKVTDLVSGYTDRASAGDDRLRRVAGIARKRGAFDILSFRRPGELKPWLPQLKAIQHEAFADNPNYVPSSDAEFALQARNMAMAADLSISRFITRGGELAGFMGAFPNLSRGIRAARGELWPLGWLAILADKRRSDTLDLNGLGILPKFQKQGGDAILFSELQSLINASRYGRAEFVQVDERNFLSKSGLDHFPIRWVKRHRVYGKDLGGAR